MDVLKRCSGIFMLITFQFITSCVGPLALNEIDPAILDLEKTIRENPEGYQAHIRLATVYFEKYSLGFHVRYLDKSIKEVQKAVRLDPESGIAHILLGVYLGIKAVEALDEELLNDAIKIYEKGYELDPDFANVSDLYSPHLLAAYFYYDKSQIDQIYLERARKEAKEAIRIVPELSEAHALLGKIYFNMGEVDLTRFELVEAVRIDPDDLESHKLLAEIYCDEWENYQREQALDQAIKEYKEIIRITPEDASAHHRLGWLYKKKGISDLYLFEVKEAIRLEKTVPQNESIGFWNTILDTMINYEPVDWLADYEIPKEFDITYNRSLGLALYVPYHHEFKFIKGFELHTYISRSFNQGKWYVKLAIGQSFVSGKVNVIAQLFREPHTDDLWRVSRQENFSGALWLHKDWHDFYLTDGYKGSMIIELPFEMSYELGYQNESQEVMKNSVEWSIFYKKNRKFRPHYPIAPGREVNIINKLHIGKPVEIINRQSSGNFELVRIQAVSGSAFDYVITDLYVNSFVHLRDYLGLLIHIRTGNTIGSIYGLQHQVPLGGFGSIHGYQYKSLGPANHYTLLNAHLTYDATDLFRDVDKLVFSLAWHVGSTWDSEDPLISKKFFQSMSKQDKHSIGITAGNNQSRFELFRSLSEGNDGKWHFYLRLWFNM